LAFASIGLGTSFLIAERTALFSWGLFGA
jgi:hypothetical protein